MLISVLFLALVLRFPFPSYALTIILQGDVRPTVEHGQVLGETDSDDAQETLELSEEQRSMQKKKTEERARIEKEQAERVQKILNNRRPMEIELRKTQGEQQTKLMLREYEQRGSSDSSVKQTPRPENGYTVPLTAVRRAELSLENQESVSSSGKQEEAKTLRSTTEEHVDSIELRVRDGVRVSNAPDGFVLESNSVTAKTTLPVQVDVATRQLFVVTPQGTKTITTLPEEVISTVEGSGFSGKVNGEVQLEAKGEDVVYKVQAQRQKRMFGFLPITVTQDLEVSAVTGAVVATQQSLPDRILNFFSF